VVVCRYKYDYRVVGENQYEFVDIEATVLAIRTREGFVDTVESGSDGTDMGIILDRTNFYAEQGGQARLAFAPAMHVFALRRSRRTRQSFDTGLFRDASGELDFSVVDVQKRGPYCLHIGTLGNVRGWHARRSVWLGCDLHSHLVGALQHRARSPKATSSPSALTSR
jgi:alanyl-tRNA synthetase